jgi:hypothetical protein
MCTPGMGYCKMINFLARPAAALSVVAAFAMSASPVMARDWHGGGGRWHRNHDRIDTGDVLAGVLIIGGIAAIASAASSASKTKRDADYRYPDRREDARPDYRSDGSRYGSQRDDGDAPGAGSGSGAALNGAVDACVDEVERGDRRVDTVDNVSRTMDGYRVEGRVGNGRNFTCTVDGGGRIRSVSVDGQAI